MKAIRLVAATFAIMALATSFFAQVSPQRPPVSALLITIEGKITKVEVATQRVVLYLDVMDPDGIKVVSWVVETGSIRELSSNGIKLTSLKAGVVVRAKGKLSGTNRLEVPASEISLP